MWFVSRKGGEKDACTIQKIYFTELFSLYIQVICFCSIYLSPFFEPGKTLYTSGSVKYSIFSALYRAIIPGFYLSIPKPLFVCFLLSVAELEEVVEFVEEVIAGLLADQEVRTFSEVIVPVLDIFQGRVKDFDLCQLLLFSYLDLLLYFSRQKDIAMVRGRNALSSLLWTVFYNPDYILC